MPLKQRLAAYYRAAAAQGRRLLTGATSPWLKERLGAEIGRCERIAEEIERATEPGADAESPRESGCGHARAGGHPCQLATASEVGSDKHFETDA
jgi:hypothetical protein